MNGTLDGPGTGFADDCMGQMMGMMMGGSLIMLLFVAVLVFAAAALVKYLRQPA
ncbi:hypothetical protein [Roseovarius sp. 217]|uniref:hypothetical protein n=1 Tax=Roseovarius sp. (strain 217) TaxID=314264 RepID=UPI0000685544|nr:hypothetical protein [Roseovarius sp. 217]EAQ24914.1 hypothetical protein ROS217_02350 [Roseovarius sp. 217]